MTTGSHVFPSVDYSAHPAFRQYAGQAHPSDDAVRELVPTIEQGIHGLSRERFSSQAELMRAFARDVAGTIDRVAEAARIPAMPTDLSALVARSLAKVSTQLLGELSYENRRFAYQPALSASDRVHELDVDGFCSFDVGTKSMAHFHEITATQRSLLREKAKREPDGRAEMSLPLEGALQSAVRTLLAEHQILEVASDYKRSPMVLLYCALEFSHDRQRWYKDCYADAGLPTSKTAYMHYDYDGDVMKAMMYLAPVNDHQGPLCYLRGSHRWPRSRFLSSLFRDFDIEHHAVYGDRGKSDAYYRPRFKDPEQRRQFMMLPSMLQGSSHFGDDVLDGTPLSARLLEAEHRFVSDGGTFVLFDGSHGIHRGAMVTEGERWALQLAFRVRPQTTLLSRAIRRLRRVAGRIRGLIS